MMPMLAAFVGLVVAPVQDDEAMNRIVERVDRELRETETRLLQDIRNIIREEIRKAFAAKPAPRPAPKDEPRPAPEPAPVPNKPVLFGIVAGDLTSEELRENGIKRAIKIEEVNGPAEKAGLKPGDLLLKIGPDAVDESNIVELLARHKPGDVIEATVLRNGKRKTFKVTLGAR